MKHKLFLVLLALSILFTSGIALAAYYADIVITNTTATNFPMVGCNSTSSNRYMADNNFFGGIEGLDTRVLVGATPIPHMLADDRTMFALPISPQSSQTLTFTTDSANLSAFDIIVGYSDNTSSDVGYIKTADAPNLELGDNFTISISGWVDTTFDVNSANTTIPSGLLSESGLVAWTAATLVDGDILTGAFNTDSSGVGSWMMIDFGAGNVTGIDTWRYYTSGANCNALWDIQGSSDNSTWVTVYEDLDMDGAVGWHTANWIEITAYRYWRSLKTDGAVPGDTHFELEVYTLDSNYTVVINKPLAFKTYVSDTGEITASISGTSASVSAAGISSGEHIITASADTANLTLSIDGATSGTGYDSIALSGASVSDTSANWTFLQNNSMPYADNITISVNGIQQLLYKPIAIVADIDGSTANLTDRSAGVNNWGTIVWGSNPTGIAITQGGLIDSEPYEFTGTSLETPDATPSVNQTSSMYQDPAGWDLADDPLYTWFDTWATATSINIAILWWTFYGIIIPIAVYAILYVMFNSLAVAGIFCIATLGYGVARGLIPFLIIIILIMWLLGLLIMERKTQF